MVNGTPLNMSAATALSRDALVDECAAALVQSFADYNAEFRAITRRAPQRFEARDWRNSLRDAVERIELYDKCVNRAVTQMRTRLGEDVTERALWCSIKRRFTELIDALPDLEFDKTFFNSVTRRTFGTIGVDAAVEFIALDLDPTRRRALGDRNQCLCEPRLAGAVVRGSARRLPLPYCLTWTSIAASALSATKCAPNARSMRTPPSRRCRSSRSNSSAPCSTN